MRNRLIQFLKPLSLTALAKDERVISAAKTLIAYYYAFVPFLALLFTATPIRSRQNFEPIWPLEWARFFGLEYLTVVDILTVVFIGTALLGVLFHRYRSVRFLVFIGLWQAHALESSFGSPNHQWYMWVYTSLIFIFLPDVWKKQKEGAARLFLLYIWAAQAIVALMYTMAGVYKMLDGITQQVKGQVGTFSMDAFAYQIAYFVPRLQQEAPLANFIIEHPALAWFPYVAFVFIQAFSLWVMVRPNLQKIWALVIILFHILTYFTMGIFFHPQLILVTLLFFNSPFARPYTSFMEFLRDLPVIGQALDLLKRRS